MAKLIVDDIQYKLAKYKDEDEIEKVVITKSDLIFGDRTLYFDLKKGVKARKDGILTIPDGYLLSFMGGEPKLYVVENELSSHDVYKHIGMHFLKYNSSFGEGSKIKVKNFLLDYIKQNSKAHQRIKELITGTRFANASELLDHVIFEVDYGFLVVIDEITEELNLVLKSFEPEIVEFKKFVSEKDSKEVIYLFDGFQEEVSESLGRSIREFSAVDTIVCPAKEDGFNEVFLKQDRWYAIRISPTMIPQIKYLAMYETAPVSAIRWIGEVDRIEKCVRPGYEKLGKYEVILRRKEKIKHPIKMSKKDKSSVPYSPRYTNMELLKKAKTIGDIF